MALAFGLVVGIWLAAAVAAITWPHATVSILERVFPAILWRVSTNEPVIALTFDDGPDPTFTPFVLDMLDYNRVRATFFLVGERARQYPAIVEAIRSGGHEIGNHSDSWRRTTAKTPESKREPRRLFYVGLTRARHEVHISFSGFTVNRTGRRYDSGPSEYVIEVAKRLKEDREKGLADVNS